ncbi:MAG: hypothetical protein JF614_08445 [Acidobacteria bacterium]|nr:hypothetical protein [Acidobacteriota bacterium]
MIGETWGVEPAETAIAFPCDQVPGDFDADYHRGVTVHTPSAVVFRWLCQLRAAPYSYDWIDNRGQQSPRQLIPGLENLKIGQTVMTIFDLIGYPRGFKGWLMRSVLQPGDLVMMRRQLLNLKQSAEST